MKEVKKQYEKYPFPIWDKIYLEETKKEMERLNIKINSSVHSWFLEDVKPIGLKKIKGNLGLWDFYSLIE